MVDKGKTDEGERSSPETSSKNLGKKIAFNSIVSMAATAVYLVSRIFLTPFTLSYISLEKFGLWGFCFTILVYAGINGVGLHNAYIKYTAEFMRQKRVDAVSKMLSTGLFCVGGIALLLFGVITFLAPYAVHWFAIEPHLRTTAEVLIVGTAVGFLADAVFSAFGSILIGVQEVALFRLVWLAASMIELVLIIVLLMMEFDVYGLLYAYYVKIALQSVCTLFFAYQKVPGLQIKFSLIDTKDLKMLFSYGGKVQALGFMGIILNTIDHVSTTAYLGLGAAGLFEIGRKLPFTGRSIVAPVYIPLLPAASDIGATLYQEPTAEQRKTTYWTIGITSALLGSVPLIVLFRETLPFYLLCALGATTLLAVVLKTVWTQLSNGEKVESPRLRSLYISGSRNTFLVGTALFSFLAAVSDHLILAWVGKGFEAAGGVMKIVCITCFIHISTGVGSHILRGINRIGKEFEYTIIRIVLALIWIPPLTSLFGIYGAVTGMMMATVVSCSYYIWQCNRLFQIDSQEFIVQSVLPSIVTIGLSAGLGFLLSFSPYTERWEVITLLAAVGVGYALLSVLLLKMLFFSKEEWQTILSLCKLQKRK